MKHSGPSLFLLLLCAGLIAPQPAGTGRPAPVMQPGQGCTVFYAASGDAALAGSNEDSFNPLTRIWFIPGADGRYGRMYLGYDDLAPQGGLNDQGLFFDGLSVPYKAVITGTHKPEFPGGPLAMIDDLLARSTTVDEALVYFERYRAPGLEAGQLFFGDKAGNSAVVEGDAIIRKRGSYQIATNFRLSENPDPPYPCDRYNSADARLSQAGGYSAELFRQILDATHQDHYVQTVYSQVYDLKKGLIYLYLFHDFQNGVVLNLADELAKGAHMVRLESLFPTNENYARWSAEQTEQWKFFYSYKIDKTVKPAGLAALAGEYRVRGAGAAPPARIYLENDQLYWQRPNEVPLELYPTSDGTVFHRYYNNLELRLAFERNLLGQVTGAQATLVYSETQVAERYALDKAGALSDSQIPWLALAIVLAVLGVVVILAVVIRRQAGRRRT